MHRTSLSAAFYLIKPVRRPAFPHQGPLGGPRRRTRGRFQDDMHKSRRRDGTSERKNTPIQNKCFNRTMSKQVDFNYVMQLDMHELLAVAHMYGLEKRQRRGEAWDGGARLRRLAPVPAPGQSQSHLTALIRTSREKGRRHMHTRTHTHTHTHTHTS